MKESMWGYLIIALGVAIIAIILLVQNLTTTSEEDFYLTREVLEASMYDAVDYGTYAKSGKLVMSEKKFVEVFLRRFAESVTNNKTYNIDFYDIHEYPPKATVVVSTDTGEHKVATADVNFNVNTYLSAVLETVSSYQKLMTIGVYNKKSKEYEGTDGYLVIDDNADEKYIVPGNSIKITANTEVYLNYRFMADNDPCGLYFTTNEKGEMALSRAEDASYPNKLNEYCEVTDKSSGQGYFVKRNALYTTDLEEE